MKVFFLTSPRSRDLELIRNIYLQIEKFGFSHTLNMALEFDKGNFYDADSQVWKKRYESMIVGISKADVCVFECSTYSIAIGQLIQESINRDKPVVVLHESDSKPFLLRGTLEVERRVSLYEYGVENMAEIIEYALGEAKELLTTRFTMLFSPKYTKHLETIKSKEGISRSDYIRRLIDKDIESRKAE